MSLRLFLLLLSFFFLFVSVAFAQNERVVVEVDFEGLKRTKPDYLLDFLDDLIGTSPSEATLQKQVQKLKNVPGVGNAIYRIDSKKEGDKIVFIVTEQTTLLPILNFGRIKDNFWFQLGGYDINWRGRGQFLSAYYQNTDKRSGGQLFFRVPYFRSANWGYSLNFTRLASVEPLYFDEGEVTYIYDNNSAAFTVIRNFGVNRNLEVGGTYFLEKYRKADEQILDNPPGPNSFRQPKLLSKLIYHENFLNYDFIYLKGYDWQLTFQNIYNTIDENWFNTLQFQGRQYFRLGNGNLALRLRLAISTNNDSPFAPFVVDSHVNLRGSGNRIDRGTAQAILNVEHRQTLFVAGSLAGQVVVFSDLGTWRNPGGTLEDLVDKDILRQYVGGGFRLIYQKIYSAVLRVDYGIDIFNTESQGLVIGLGQYF